MDPLTNLLNYLQKNFADSLPTEAVSAIERTAGELFSKFEVVPKHEFEAQVQILESLQAQVDQLELRLQRFEQED